MDIFLIFAYITGGINIALALVYYVFPSRKISLWLKGCADVVAITNLVFVLLATNNKDIIANIVVASICLFREIIFVYREKYKFLNHLAWPIGLSVIMLLSLIFTYKSPLSLLPTFGSVIATMSFYALDQRIWKIGAFTSSILYVVYYSLLLQGTNLLTIFPLICAVAGLIGALVGMIIVFSKHKKTKTSLDKN